MNTAVAILLLLSIAVIVWLPARPAGIVTKAMNDPPLFAVGLAGAVLTIEFPTRTIIGEDGVNPLPIIVTVDWTVPEVGFKVSVGGVNANVALAVFPEVSVTTTTLPVANAVKGTIKLVETFPPVEVVPAAATIKPPLTVTLKAVPAAAKPVPAMPIGTPLVAPAIGRVRVRLVVTVNVVIAVLVPSLSNKVYVPDGIAGA